jgi:hypothetical protein
MLEDHSPTGRSSSRKPFRRKGAKTVIFNNSCTYYQLDSTAYDSSDAEDEEDDKEDFITDGQIDEFDQQSSELDSHIIEEKVNALQNHRDDFEDLDELVDIEPDAPHPSPRIGIESVALSGIALFMALSLFRSCRAEDYAYR